MDDIEVKSSVEVMAETFGRKLVAERSTTSFISYSTLNVPLLFICRIIRNHLLKGMTQQNKIYKI
jgi:hypothetical protein